MRLRFFTAPALLSLVSVIWVACEHAPPGTHVDLAFAKHPTLVRLPATPVPVLVRSSPSSPGLPSSAPVFAESKTEKVAEAYQRGDFCAKAGKDEEAIAAFREAVKIDPTFVDAWTYLAAMYEKAGNQKEALEAFKHAKLATTKGSG